MRKLLLLPLILAGCSTVASVHGSDNTDKALTGRLDGSDFVVTMAGGTDCRTGYQPKQWRQGQRQFPMTCEDGRSGTAEFVTNHVKIVGNSVTRVIKFRLDDGTSGQATFLY